MATGYICNGSMTVDERKIKIERALALFHSGHKVPEIAVELDCDRSTIYKWLHLNHIKMRSRKYPDELIDRIAEMYQTMTRLEISKELGLDYPVVQYIINSNYIRKNEELI